MDLVHLPKGKNYIRVKWVYKTEFNEKGEVENYKAMLDTIRNVLVIAAQNKRKAYQMDVKLAF